ncbi:uncharacterized protein LOC142571896 isoform X3 [Dermacentor variabilis]|uniref:uncharacterized protein LOC142571896 isoform X3 n=1 Tax=Dermacentor variabilis TaxID=34621 RepID=UPI003F5BB807
MQIRQFYQGRHSKHKHMLSASAQFDSGGEVAEFMARLPSKGGAFIRKVCQNGGNLKELLPFLHTPDYLEEWKRASGTCGVKTS